MIRTAFPNHHQSTLDTTTQRKTKRLRNIATTMQGRPASSRQRQSTPSSRRTAMIPFASVQALLLLLILPTTVVHGDLKKSSVKTGNNNNNNKQRKHWTEYDDLGANLETHPDPNDEHYEGMIYVGRWEHTEDHHQTVVDTAKDPNARRLGWDVDNHVKYIFGTSFDESHKEIEERDLHPDHHTTHDGDLPHLSNGIVKPTKTREEVLKERRHKEISEQGPKPFGHVDTHPLDGGAMPPTVVKVEPFFLDATPVTNEEFGKFVQKTHYETEAERYGWSYVLRSFLGSKYTPKDTTTDIHVDPEAPDWVAVEGAYWRRPEGPHSSYKFREKHPVVHVSHKDAAEYCHWKDKRLPGEREWEAAARAGHWGPNNRTLFSWGENDTVAYAAQYANLWGGGEFPHENLAEDGWRGTSPVKHYPPNPMGFFDMTGNVWEWMRGGKMVSGGMNLLLYDDLGCTFPQRHCIMSI